MRNEELATERFCLGSFASHHDLSACCLNCDRADQTCWINLSARQSAEFEQKRRKTDLSVGEALYLQGDLPSHVYCLESGLLAVRRSDEEGRSVLLRLIRPGEVFGYREQVMECERDASVEALHPSRCCRIPVSTFLRLVDDNPDLARDCLKYISEEVRFFEERYQVQQTLPSLSRLARLLIELDEELGEPAAPGIRRIALPVNRRDLGALIGTVPETLSRTVRRLEDEGIVSFQGQLVEIRDHPKLRDLALLPS